MEKALDNILQHYLRQETLVSGDNGQVDEELLQSLHKCLQEKGVLKEVHAFLRQRLVAVLQGTWPQLFEHFQTDNGQNPLILKLIEDFLCSHKLLFTLSVLSTELGDEFSPKSNFGKFSSSDAEELLIKLGITSDSTKCLKILDSYSNNLNESLLESIINTSGFSILRRKNSEQETDEEEYEILPNQKNFQTLDDRLKKIDDKYRHERNKSKNLSRTGAKYVDQRFRHLALALERDKQIQLQIAIDKFKSEEICRIREEIETEQKFELLRRENELLVNYEEKVNHMKKNLEREKELWLVEKTQKEREIFERREELLLAIQSVREEANNSEFHGHPTGPKHFEILRPQTQPQNAPDQNDTTEVGHPLQVVLPVVKKTREQREMERIYLLKEAKLRNVIEKLEKENKKLKTEPQPPQPPPQSTNPRSSYGDAENSENLEFTKSHYQNRRRYKTKTTDPRLSGMSTNNTLNMKSKWRPESSISEFMIQNRRNYLPQPQQIPDTDTIAFLQYQLECQTEEIEKLRNIVQTDREQTTGFTKVSFGNNITSKIHSPQLGSNHQSNSRNPPADVTNSFQSNPTDIDEFLKEAKKRISDIEQEAQVVEETLIRMHRDPKFDSLLLGRKNTTKFPNAEGLPAKNHFPLPPAPKLPKSIFHKLNTLSELDLSHLKSTIRPPITDISSLLSIFGNNQVPFITQEPFPASTSKQFQNPPPPIISSDQVYLRDSNMSELMVSKTPVIIPEKLYEPEVVHTSSPPYQINKKFNQKDYSKSQRSISTASSISTPSNLEDQKDQKSNYPPPPHLPVEVEEDFSHKSSSSKSFNEKASRSGALTMDKVKNRDKDYQQPKQPKPNRDDEKSVSFELKSSSLISEQYPNKVAKIQQEIPVDRKALVIIPADLKNKLTNPTNNSTNNTLQSTFHSMAFNLKPTVLVDTNSQELDDNEKLETSNDVVIPDDSFWRMKHQLRIKSSIGLLHSTEYMVSSSQMETEHQ